MISIQVILLAAAFWTAVFVYRGAHPYRYLAGLALGAASTRLGWGLLYFPEIKEHPSALLHPAGGLSILFLPVGALVFSRGDAGAWRALSLGVAVARLGCLLGGCCGGTGAPWGVHATQLYESLVFVALFFVLRRLPEGAAAGVSLASFGAIRLAVEPLRVAPVAEPVLSAAVISLGWVLLGLTLSLQSKRLRRRTLTQLAPVGFARCTSSLQVR